MRSIKRVKGATIDNSTFGLKLSLIFSQVFLSLLSLYKPLNKNINKSENYVETGRLRSSQGLQKSIPKIKMLCIEMFKRWKVYFFDHPVQTYILYIFEKQDEKSYDLYNVNNTIIQTGHSS